MSDEMQRYAGEHRFGFAVFAISPVVAWFVTAEKLGVARVTKPKIKGLIELFPHTFEYPLLYIVPICAAIVSIFIWIMAVKLSKSEFKGMKYKYKLRGADLVSADELNQKTRKRKEKQVDLATIYMPTT
ncbi:hypothetical protein JJP72_24140, partial [Enterobacter hormaechei]|nr:hypothetical protein [Enterobacter hormaechei]